MLKSEDHLWKREIQGSTLRKRTE